MSLFTSAAASPPAANAGTQFYDGASITTVPAANGIREFLNAVQAATGLTCLALNGSVPGSSTGGLVKGSSGYTNLMAQINAVIQPSDQVFILWDQGEGDADATPHPVENDYKATINQLHADLVSDMSRTKATCPFIMSSLGTTSASDGSLGAGTTDGSWQTIKNAIYNCSLEQPFNHFSHTNLDLVRTDLYHYDGTSQGRQGKRFAQTVKTILGLASGEAHWQISTGAIVDATHTNINVVHNLGTDFTPTSGGNGWEVTGNNGATWIAATSARNSATQLQLTTGVSLTNTSARKVRYQSGMLPPDAAGNNPTTAPILDNSALQVPLNYTTWDISPTPLSVVPVPTWRYGVALTGSGQVQTTTALPLGPSIGAQKFVIITLAGLALNAVATLTPRDITGAASGTPVTTTLVKRQGGVQILQATLGSDANAAYSVDVSVDYGSNPFGGSIIQLYTVPFADMSSTTNTGVGGASAASTAATATVNVSSGGFIIQVAKIDVAYTTAAVLTGTETFAKRTELGSGIPTYSADASNCSANASSSATGTFQNSGNIDLALAAWH